MWKKSSIPRFTKPEPVVACHSPASGRRCGLSSSFSPGPRPLCGGFIPCSGKTCAAANNPGSVWADRTRLRQCLINLLSNAIKYNKPNGTVSVECGQVRPDTLRISVRDSGEGLSAQQLEQLFQPFNRLGKEAGAQEGSGIGLVVTKKLVELMGGSIGAESTLTQGSVFWIELILDQAPQAPQLEAKANQPALSL